VPFTEQYITKAVQLVSSTSEAVHVVRYCSSFSSSDLHCHCTMRSAQS
jgi:hypothetical protein